MSEYTQRRVLLYLSIKQGPAHDVGKEGKTYTNEKDPVCDSGCLNPHRNFLV